MSLPKDDELLSYFPKKRNDALNNEAEPYFLLENDTSTEDAAETSALWDSEETADIEEDDLLKTEKEGKLAPGLEEIEEVEHEVIDDPVHVYLREIGKVQLLTAKDEKLLASKLEEAKYLKKIEELYFQQYNKYPTTKDIVIYLLRHLLATRTFIEIIADKLELALNDSFVNIINKET